MFHSIANTLFLACACRTCSQANQLAAVRHLPWLHGVESGDAAMARQGNNMNGLLKFLKSIHKFLKLEEKKGRRRRSGPAQEARHGQSSPVPTPVCPANCVRVLLGLLFLFSCVLFCSETLVDAPFRSAARLRRAAGRDVAATMRRAYIPSCFFPKKNIPS